MIDPQNDQLPVGLIAQLVEHCTSIAEVRVRVLLRPCFRYSLGSIAKVRRTLQHRTLFKFNSGFRHCNTEKTDIPSNMSGKLKKVFFVSKTAYFVAATPTFWINYIN